MSATPASLFAASNRGLLSRRQLLQALGLAVAPVALSALGPSASFAQGQCGGARKGTPECDPTPAKLPFASTGWKTVLLDHLSCQAADYAKEAAFYSALMNWPVRSDDGKQAMLDIGGWGGLQVRGGYTAPPSPPAAAAPAGRQVRPRGGAPRAPRLAVFDSICWGIEPWDAKTVEAELKKRGLNPVADQSRRLPEFPRQGSGRLRPADQQRQSRQSPQGRGYREDGRAGAVRDDELEDGVAGSHLVRGVELQGDGRVLSRAARMEARGRTKAARTAATSATSAASSSAVAIAVPARRGAATAAPCLDRPHLVRHHAVRSGHGESRTREARAERARRHRRARRHSHRAVQELSHHHAERIRSADQRDDAGDPRRLSLDDEPHLIEVMREHAVAVPVEPRRARSS